MVVRAPSTSSRAGGASAGPARRVGSQVPRLAVAPSGAAYSEGPDASELCRAYWFELDEWQDRLLDTWLSRDADGRLLVLTAGLACPRQNGKNGAVEALEFYLLVTDPAANILHTAHRVKTCKKVFRRLVKVFTDKRHPEILALVRQIRFTNGEEGIYLWHPDHIGEVEGASIEYSARSRSAARGFEKISHIVYDEAQELTDEQVEALLFTLGASETDRFVLYMGTPPGPNCPGEVFGRTRRRALSDPTPHTAWHEWSVKDLPAPDSTFDDVEDLVYETNPAMGTRLSIEFTREEFANASVEGFARERLGWWAPVERAPEHVFDRSEWEACSTADPPMDAPAAFGVKFGTSGADVALCACVMAEVPYVELIECRGTNRGTAWLRDFALANQGVPIAIDGKSGAQALRDRIELNPDFEGELVTPTPADVISAASGMLNSVRERDLSWYGPDDAPEDRLTASVLSVTRRPIGSGGGWGFGGDDPTPAEAAALALWAARQATTDDEEMEVFF